jgi:hypothetical protein
VLSNQKRKRKILICEIHARGVIWAINPDFGPFNNYGPEARLILSVHIPNQRLISILRCIKNLPPKTLPTHPVHLKSVASLHSLSQTPHPYHASPFPLSPASLFPVACADQILPHSLRRSAPHAVTRSRRGFHSSSILLPPPPILTLIHAHQILALRSTRFLHMPRLPRWRRRPS